MRKYSVGKFFKALFKFWWALMSSAALTAIGLFAIWQGKSSHWIIMTSISAGILFFFIAAFLAWNEELLQCEKEKEKRERPILAPSFLFLGTRWLLRLQNTSSFVAVGIHIDDIRSGQRLLRFFPPVSVAGIAGGTIDCEVSENARLIENDNVLALFDRIQMADGRMISDQVRIRATYSNMDTQTDQKTWVLSFLFWYDHREKRIVTDTPSIELLTKS